MVAKAMPDRHEFGKPRPLQRHHGGELIALYMSYLALAACSPAGSQTAIVTSF